jgi:hypothetical protein
VVKRLLLLARPLPRPDDDEKRIHGDQYIF